MLKNSEYVAERVEPWSYLKFPYLKKIGWKGFADGKESGVYKATPLSRLNAADGMATPLAQVEYKRFYESRGGKSVNHTLATHWIPSQASRTLTDSNKTPQGFAGNTFSY